MRYALLSDVHNRPRKLAVVLDHARSRGVDRILSLGDVGGEECLIMLRKAGAVSTFGNYEVSGWRKLPPQLRSWVRNWPPLLVEDSFLAVHASPQWPNGLHSIQDFGDWLNRTGESWRALFPYLTEDEDNLWQALSHLETADKQILFHGHTHQHSIWRWQPGGSLRRLTSTTVQIQASHRYIVGVGSVGLPEDRGWAAYTLYDTETNCLQQIHIDNPASANEFAPNDTAVVPDIEGRRWHAC
jgi:predicted phosphodiesterase